MVRRYLAVWIGLSLLVAGNASADPCGEQTGSNWFGNTIATISAAWELYQLDGWPEGTPDKVREPAEFRYQDNELEELKAAMHARNSWFQDGYSLPNDIAREGYFQQEIDRLSQPYIQEFLDQGHNQTMAKINAAAKCERVSAECRAVGAAYNAYVGSGLEAERARDQEAADRVAAQRARDRADQAEADEQARILIEEFYTEIDYSYQSEGEVAPSLARACMAISQAPTCEDAKKQLSSNHAIGNCKRIKAIHCGRRP